MQTLLEKSKINKKALAQKIHNIVGNELSQLSQPCYYPSMKKYYYELLHLCGLTEKDMTEFCNRFYKGTKFDSFKLQKDPITNFYIFLYWYFVKNKDIHTSESAMFMHIIRYYSNLMNKSIKYCDPNAFKLALETISKTHLYVRERSIPSSLIYMAREMIKKYEDRILTGDPNYIAVFITESRHRLSQSAKSFATQYYKLKASGTSMIHPYESDEGQEIQADLKDVTVIGLAKKITIYNHIDDQSINEAKKISGISITLAHDIVEDLSDPKHTDRVTSVLRQFFVDMPDVTHICGSEYFNYVRKLLAVKKSSKPVYFKKEITMLLLDILKNIDYLETFQKQSSQTQFNILTFLSFYITMTVRRTIC